MNSDYLIASILTGTLLTLVTFFSNKIQEYIPKFFDNIFMYFNNEICFTIDSSRTICKDGKTIINSKSIFNEFHFEAIKFFINTNQYNTGCKNFEIETYFVGINKKIIINPTKEIFIRDLRIIIEDTCNIDSTEFHSENRIIKIYKNIKFLSTDETIKYIHSFIEECGSLYKNHKYPKIDTQYLYKLERKTSELLRYNLTSKKTLNDTFFPDKSLLIKMLDNIQNGNLDKLGLLFHGIPGTGKTTLIKAISNYTKRDIIYINLKTITDSETLENIFFNKTVSSFHIPFNKRIYVIEDIDADSDITHSRTEQKEKEHEQKNIILLSEENDTKTLTLKDLLQLFDGVIELKDVIYIFTTNHIEKLDPALIRPGRINLQIHMTYMTKECMMEMVNKFFPELVIENKYLNVQITASKLEGIYFQSNKDQDIFKQKFIEFYNESSLNSI